MKPYTETEVIKMGKEIATDIKADFGGIIEDQVAFEVAKNMLDGDIKLKKFFKDQKIKDPVGAFANYI